MKAGDAERWQEEARPGAPLSPGLDINDGCHPGLVHLTRDTFAELLSNDAAKDG